jgi:hypothetical protein
LHKHQIKSGLALLDGHGRAWTYAEIYNPQLRTQARYRPVAKQENEIGLAVTTDGRVPVRREERMPVVKSEPSIPRPQVPHTQARRAPAPRPQAHHQSAPRPKAYHQPTLRQSASRPSASFSSASLPPVPQRNDYQDTSFPTVPRHPVPAQRMYVQPSQDNHFAARAAQSQGIRFRIDAEGRKVYECPTGYSFYAP